MAAPVDLAVYRDTLIVLATAGVVVPIMHRARLSPVLGYLAAGAILGPYGLGALVDLFPSVAAFTITDIEDIAWLAELGVVFLLFVIGLELSLERLKVMYRLVFGLGGLQVVISAVVIGLTAPLFGNSVAASVLIGLSLALSSTALVLDRLSRTRRMNSSMGRASFAVLLFQDLAVIPILFLVGFLSGAGEGSVTQGLLLSLAQGVIVLAVILVLGRVLLRPLFRLVAGTESPELFMATTLLVVISAGVLTAGAGLSMALGGFVAGLLLAETEFRKAIEVVIEPFKGLLLGVFFISVGARIDLVALFSDPIYLLVCAGGVMVIKFAILAPLVRAFGVKWPAAIETGLLLSTGGEFAFIVIGLANTAGIIATPVAGLLLAVVALTMSAVPVLGWLGQRVVASLEPEKPKAAALLEMPASSTGVDAIVVGAGRVGRLVAEMLEEHGVGHILTDRHAATVLSARQAGFNAFFGSAEDPHFLKACGLTTAKALIITVNTSYDIDQIVESAKTVRADVPMIVRARDDTHASRLYSLGVTDAVPETIEASLQLSEAALVALQVPAGPVIASIHDKRDEFRSKLQSASDAEGRAIRGLRSSRLGLKKRTREKKSRLENSGEGTDGKTGRE